MSNIGVFKSRLLSIFDNLRSKFIEKVETDENDESSFSARQVPIISKKNPWKEDLERLSNKPRPDPEMLHMASARLQEIAKKAESAPSKRRADGTTVKMKMWWENPWRRGIQTMPKT